MTLSITPENSKKHQVLFHGNCGEFYNIWIVNIFLSIVTLGIYSAWAAVKTRRYFYVNTEINGGHFDYHAKALHLLLNRVVMGIVLILYMLLVRIQPSLESVAIIIIPLVPYIILRSWRYTAIMSSFQGVRFNYKTSINRGYWVMFFLPTLLVVGLWLAMSILIYGLYFVGRLSLKFTSIASVLNNNYYSMNDILAGIIIVLFIAAIIVINGIVHAAVNDLYVNCHAFGRSKFKASLDKKVFMRIILRTFLVFLPFCMLGLFIFLNQISLIAMLFMLISVIMGVVVAFSYSFVAKRNYVYNQTVIADQVKIISIMKVGSYCVLTITNTLIIFFTLGFGIPIAAIRHARYLANHTQIEGNISFLTLPMHTDNAND